MKKTFFALTLIAAASSAMAQSNVSLYGKIDTGVEVANSTSPNTASSASTRGRVVSNDSYIGVRGGETLGSARVFFQLEGSVGTDDGSSKMFGRNTGVGISGRLGTLKLGQWDTPYKTSTQGLDPFQGSTGALTSVLGGYDAGAVSSSEGASSFYRLAKNSVVYESPEYAGFSGSVAYGFAEDTTVNGNVKPSLFSIAGTYKNGPILGTVAYENHKDVYGVGLGEDAVKLGASYDFGVVRVGAIGEHTTYETFVGKVHRNGFGLTASAPLYGGEVKASYGRVHNLSGTNDTGAQAFSVGYDYSLSKRTSLYTRATILDNDDNAVQRFGNNGAELNGPFEPGVTFRSFAVGVRHTF